MGEADPLAVPRDHARADPTLEVGHRALGIACDRLGERDRGPRCRSNDAEGLPGGGREAREPGGDQRAEARRHGQRLVERRLVTQLTERPPKLEREERIAGGLLVQADQRRA